MFRRFGFLFLISLKNLLFSFRFRITAVNLGLVSLSHLPSRLTFILPDLPRMRVSVPNIPVSLLNAVKYPQVSLDAAINKIAEFLSPGNATVLTGAGVSVDSGIRAYRGHNGRYLNPNYK